MAKNNYLEYTFYIRAKVTVTVPKSAYQEHDEANEEKAIEQALKEVVQGDVITADDLEVDEVKEIYENDKDE